MLCILLIAFLTAPSPAAAGDTGATAFTFDLHHHDPPPSPLQAPASHHLPAPWKHRVSPRILAAIGPAAAGAEAPVTTHFGMPVMKISVGTPPVDIYGIADTGSDLIWTQCTPCPGCFTQSHPLFDPANSSTYRTVPCRDPKCPTHSESPTCGGPPENRCRYTYGYTDRSHTAGDLAVDKFTVASGAGAPVTADMYFGCGHDNNGTFTDSMTGIIGLGEGAPSLISQLAAAAGVKRMMSQCLMPYGADPKKAGKMTFGSAAEVAGPGVATIVTVAPYVAQLQGITVGNVFLAQPAAGNRRILLDSGTSMTYLPTELYNQLVTEVKKQVAMTPLDDPDKRVCYKTDNMVAPKIAFRFLGGEVGMSRENMFAQDPAGVYCLVAVDAASIGGVAIYGTFAQANFQVGFNLDDRTISLKPTDCTLH